MFGELMRGHRERRGLTQEDLATRSGISARHIRDLEAARTIRPRASTVRLIGDALELDRADGERFLCAALAGAAVPPSAMRPAQLDVRGFADRAAELARLDTVRGEGGDRAATVVVLVLLGAAGVGKATLAVRWAHRVAHRFPDRQWYVARVRLWRAR